ncbi:MAG TPA: phasin family protein [Vicinamibacteria bacterium]|nr:phasin family protein [Vicinamibacteria bacterium]
MKKQAPRKKPAKTTGAMIKDRWDATVKSLAAAEAQMEKQVRQALKKNKLAGDAADALKDLRAKLDRERKKLSKELDSRLHGLQSRVKKERKALGHLVDDAVRGALATLNIPSRKEVAELTRKVDELSRKIDGFKAPTRRKASKRPALKAEVAALPQL